eukprot:m.150090 g.150090  ORF g.150090 m.150090 type:complete len:617 (-) comp16872_c0_seq3:195-2045(-)
MAMRDLVAGECGGDNPLMGLVRNATRDKGAARDTHLRPMLAPRQVLARGRGRGRTLLPRPANPQDAAALARSMGQLNMRQEPGGAWADEFEGFQAGDVPPEEMLEYEQAFRANPWIEEFVPEARHGFVRGGADEQWQGERDMYDETQRHLSGIGGSSQTDWAQQFLQEDTEQTAHEPNLAGAAQHLLDNVHDPKLVNGSGRAQSAAAAAAGAGATSSLGAWAAEFEAQNESWTDEFARSSSTPLEDWTAAYKRSMENNTTWAEEFEALNDPAQSRATNSLEHMEQSEQDESAAAAASRAVDYPFEAANEYANSGRSCEELLAQGETARMEGYLVKAILLFEAAVQLDRQNPKCWEQLGICRAENEQEDLAITALSECVRLDRYNQKAHMALAVSYTNEHQFPLAYKALEAALRSNEAYRGLPPLSARARQQPPAMFSRFAPSTGMVEELSNLYCQAAQLSPEGQIDPEVQVGLGVLFNISGEYDKAVECFQAAISARADDSALWNKLGATLANSDRSAEAVEAYRTALQLRPGHIRARFNLGISCYNLKAYKEAAEHFLTALSMQQSHGGDDASMRTMSDAIWDALRMTLVTSSERELAQKTRDRNLDAFRGRFEF